MWRDAVIAARGGGPGQCRNPHPRSLPLDDPLRGVGDQRPGGLPSQPGVNDRVVDVEICEHVGSRSIPIAKHREEDVVGADVLIAEASRLAAGLPDDVPCSFSQIHGSEVIPTPETTKT
ncbi:MAG: hypothetical protein JWO69_587 [Thermoleophilia bacterium]|jgi:hypothetical protein|nr:hypothetical protein [Thermoleophilia bacterium]